VKHYTWRDLVEDSAPADDEGWESIVFVKLEDVKDIVNQSIQECADVAASIDDGYVFDKAIAQARIGLSSDIVDRILSLKIIDESVEKPTSSD